MKIIRTITTTFLLLFISFSIYAIARQQGDTLTVSAPEFKKLLELKHGVLIDVRTPEEFEKENIAGAININVKADDFNLQINKLDKNKPYFVYCGAGKRGSLAMEIMKKEGFTNLYNLKGGITEWKNKKLPVVKK